MGRHCWLLIVLALAVACVTPGVKGVARADSLSECARFEDADFDREIEACTLAINSGEHSEKMLAIAYFFRAQAYNGKEQHELAIRDFDRAIAINPDNPKFAVAYTFRGAAHALRGKNDLAISDFSKAIALDPKSEGAYFNRGVTYIITSQYSRAVKDFNSAISLNPKNSRSFRMRGNAYSKKAKFDSAIKDYSSAISLDPDNAELWNNRCWNYVLNAQYALALGDCNRSVKLDPKSAYTYDSRALAYEKLGNLGAAQRDYRKALSLDSTLASSTEGLKRVVSASVGKKLAEPVNTTNAESVSSVANSMSNTDIAGDLLSKVSAANTKTCANACASDAACVAWTFNVWNQKCFTKSTATQRLFEPSGVSGMGKGKKPPPKSNLAMAMIRYRGKAFPGESYRSTNKRNYELCEDACETDSKCAAWSFIDEKNQCKLFSTAGEYSSADGADSGVKRQLQN